MGVQVMCKISESLEIKQDAEPYEPVATQESVLEYDVGIYNNTDHSELELVDASPRDKASIQHTFEELSNREHLFSIKEASDSHFEETVQSRQASSFASFANLDRIANVTDDFEILR